MVFEAFQSTLLTLGPNDRFVIAVSGGVDSMVLLECFRRSMDPSRFVVAHYDHGVRLDSSRDLTFVSEFCERRGLSFVSQTRTTGTTSENSMRVLRRCFLTKVKRSHCCQWIASAHHWDDNLETFLMRLIRGGGLRGLSSMQFRNGTSLKPLLEVTRSEIENFAEINAVPFREDSTNESLRYFRNRIRWKLIPSLKSLAKEFGGLDAFRDRFDGVLSDLRWASDTFDEAVRVVEARTVEQGDFFWKIHIDDIGRESMTIQSGVIRSVLRNLTKKEITRREIDRVWRAIYHRRRGISVTGKIEITYSMGFAYFQTPKHRRAIGQLTKKLSGLGFRAPFPGARLASGDKLYRWFQQHRVPRPERAVSPISLDPVTGEVTKVGSAMMTMQELTGLGEPLA